MLAYLSILLLAVLLPHRALTQSEVTANEGGDDIILTPEQQALLEATSNPNDPFSPQNAVVRNSRSLWPQGRVPYVLDPSLNDRARTAISQAINTYAASSCIQFTLRSNEADYVRFYRGRGCFSYIGRIGGPQDISIGQGCESEGVVIHEMFHALGRWHEQSRPDRDMYVRINRNNIQSGTETNFEITNPSFVTTQSIPYDLRSVMHYSATAFSRNGLPTIEPVDPSIRLNDLGQRQGLSSFDLQHVNTLYCRNTPPGNWASWGSWSACSRTCNGGVRSRTRTCIDGGCEGSNIQSEPCGQTSCPVPSSWGSWSSWGSCSASCGGGRQRRVRSCIGGNNCIGVNNQFRDCATNSCPQPATWGSWGSWSSCTSTCQGGFRQRRRTCQNGNTCSGASFENENCNTNVPCVKPPNPNSGEWSEWSVCTLQCGGGERFRVRMCGQSSGCESQSESCNTQDCRPEPTLRGIRHHGCWYLNIRTGRLGTLEGLHPDLNDNPFTRTNAVSKCGLASQTESFRFFGVSLGYCITGSNNLLDYQYVRSELCQDGKGGYNQGFFIMDVYEINNPQSFMDSALGIPEESEGGSGAEGAHVSSIMFILVAAILGLVTVI